VSRYRHRNLIRKNLRRERIIEKVSYGECERRNDRVGAEGRLHSWVLFHFVGDDVTHGFYPEMNVDKNQTVIILTEFAHAIIASLNHNGKATS